MLGATERAIAGTPVEIKPADSVKPKSKPVKQPVYPSAEEAGYCLEMAIDEIVKAQEYLSDKSADEHVHLDPKCEFAIETAMDFIDKARDYMEGLR